VREQLEIYSGTQFAPEVVQAAIQENILEAHQAEIALQRKERTPDPNVISVLDWKKLSVKPSKIDSDRS
jgi:hypothetical protein